MSNQFLPSQDLPFLAKLGTSGVMISDDLTGQDEIFDHLDRLSVGAATSSSLRSLLGQREVPAKSKRDTSAAKKNSAHPRRRATDRQD